MTSEIEEAVARVETLFLQAHDALEVALEHVRIAENTEAARVYYEVNAALYAVRGRPDLLSALTASQAEVERLTRERDEARGDADDLKERLYDVVMIEAEEWAIGGGPGFKDRKEKAWNRAREPFEP